MLLPTVFSLNCSFLHVPSVTLRAPIFIQPEAVKNSSLVSSHHSVIYGRMSPDIDKLALYAQSTAKVISGQLEDSEDKDKKGRSRHKTLKLKLHHSLRVQCHHHWASCHTTSSSHAQREKSPLASKQPTAHKSGQ